MRTQPSLLVRINHKEIVSVTSRLGFEQVGDEPGINRYLAHFLSQHKEKKPRITCPTCGKEQLMFMNFISHTFKHKVYDFQHEGMVALLGLGSVNGKNV